MEMVDLAIPSLLEPKGTHRAIICAIYQVNNMKYVTYGATNQHYHHNHILILWKVVLLVVNKICSQ